MFHSRPNFSGWILLTILLSWSLSVMAVEPKDVTPTGGSTTPPKAPTTPKPTTDKPTAPKPTTPKPTTPKPSTDKPSTDKPTTTKPSTDKPSTDKPTTTKPTTTKPTPSGKLEPSADPWSQWDQEFGEFGNPQDLRDHQEAIGSAIRETDTACEGDCDSMERFLILNQTYYANLADTGNQNLPLGPVETMAYFYSPQVEEYRNFAQSAEVQGTEEQIDQMVRNGQMSVILPGQTTSLDFYLNEELTKIQRLSLATTPIFVGSLESIQNAFSLMPGEVNGMKFGVATAVGQGYGGGFFINTSSFNENGQPMLDFSVAQDQQLETILHEANHSGELALTLLYMESQETNLQSQIPLPDVSTFNEAGELAITIRLQGATITDTDCPSCNLLGEPDLNGNNYLASLTEIRARLSENSQVGDDEFVVRLKELYQMEEDQARQLIDELRDSESLRYYDQILESGAEIGMDLLGIKN